MISWLVSQVSYLWSRIRSVADDAYRWARDKANDAYSRAKSVAWDLYFAARDYVVQKYNDARSYALSKYYEARAFADGLVRDARRLIDRVKDDLIDFALRQFHRAVGAAEALVNGVKTLINAVRDRALAFALEQFHRAVGAAQAIVNGVTAIFRALFERGQADLQRLKLSISGDDPKNQQTLLSFASNPVGTIAAYLFSILLDVLFYLLAQGIARPGIDIGPPPMFGDGYGGDIVIGPGPPPGESGLSPPLGSIRVSGYTFNPPSHPGIDLGLSNGDPVYAMHDATVRTAVVGSRGYGVNVTIEGSGWWSRYAHLQQLLVSPGDRVRAGQPVGLGNSTGNSTGPHLHLELKYQGKFVDPLFYL